MGYEPILHYCARCHCSVPLDEWQPTPGLTALKHLGPMRDHKPDRYVEPDEDGDITCGFVEPIPEKAPA